MSPSVPGEPVSRVSLPSPRPLSQRSPLRAKATRVPPWESATPPSASGVAQTAFGSPARGGPLPQVAGALEEERAAVPAQEEAVHEPGLVAGERARLAFPDAGDVDVLDARPVPDEGHRAAVRREDRARGMLDFEE